MKGHIADRTANIAAAASGLGFSITLANIDTIVSIVAGLCAIAAAICAARYHIKKTRALPSAPETKDRS